MATQEAIRVVKHYLQYLQGEGMTISFGVLYGSQARGDNHADSDFDLLVISPQFDQTEYWDKTEMLWHATVHTDSRIEPVGVGLKRWREDDYSPLIEIARQEGEIIRLT